MRKAKLFLLPVTIIVLVLVLSSCAINVFKGIDKPSNLSDAANSALESANNGDAQSAVNLSTQVITEVASSSSESPDLYSALTTSATSTQSKEIINEVASNVSKIKEKILSGNISKSSTEGVAVKNAAVAMVRSVAKVKKIEISDVINNILKVLASTSQNANYQTKSNALLATTPSATQISQTMLMLLSITKDMPTMNLMSELTSLVAVYGGNDTFNWDAATILYDALYSSTALFDSNGDGILTKQDEIFKYIWDSNKDEFKNVNDVDWKGVLKLQLPTYGNQTLCERFMEKFYQAISCSRDALNHLPSSLSNMNTSEANSFLNAMENIYNNLDADKLASFKTFGDFISFLVSNFNGM